MVHGLGSGAINVGLNGYAAHYLSAPRHQIARVGYDTPRAMGPTQVSTASKRGRSPRESFVRMGPWRNE